MSYDIIITHGGQYQAMRLDLERALELRAKLDEQIAEHGRRATRDGGWQILRLTGDEDGDVDLICSVCPGTSGLRSIASMGGYPKGNQVDRFQVADLLRAGQRHLNEHHRELVTVGLVYVPEGVQGS